MAPLTLRILVAITISVPIGIAGLTACTSRCASGYGKVGDRCLKVVDDSKVIDGSATGNPTIDNANSAQSHAGTSASMISSSPSGAPPSSGLDSPSSQNAGAASGSAAAGSGSATPESSLPESQSASSQAAESAKGPAETAAEGPCQGRPGETICDAEVMHRCDETGVSAAAEVCMSEALCHVGSASGACAVCNPGTYSCEEASLFECGENGQYRLKEECASADLCKVDAGACTPMVCMPSARTCSADGSTLRVCNADGSAFAEEQPCGAGLCDSTAGRCNKCMPGSKRCEGGGLVTCSTDGQTSSTDQCEPRGECWNASCVAGGCQNTPKVASISRCTSGYCDGIGMCVGCLEDRHCDSNEFCDQSRTCKQKPCGNGVIDPGEHCETQGPNGYQRGCDRETCRLEDSVYAGCTVGPAGGPAGTCPFNANQNWFCGATGACSHGCEFADQCRTTSGRGTCAGGFCVISCNSPADCPTGLGCQDASGLGLNKICGTSPAPAPPPSQ